MLIIKIRNKYTWIDKFYILCSIIKTKFIFFNARLIRAGFNVRGKNMISVGKGFTTGYNCRLEAFITEDKSNNKKIIIG